MIYNDITSVLFRLITQLLIPPGLFILISVILSVCYSLKRRNKTASIFMLFALFVWLFSIAPVTDKIIAPLESGVTFPPEVSGDVIVLLGGGLYDSVPDLTGEGAPKEDMLSRLITVVRLYRQLKLPIIVSGGAPHEFKTPEANIVARLLFDLGVPKEHVILENKSTDTLENAKNTSLICKQHEFARPILVTSAYHIKRSILAFNKFGMCVQPVPANFRNSDCNEYTWASYLPAADTMETAWRAMREYIALIYYRMFLSLQ